MPRVLIVLLVAAACALGQQVPDPNFRYHNANPAFAPAKGPTVCVDSAHNNIHTATGGYKTYAELLTGDGYVVTDLNKKFAPEILGRCQVLVVVNPVGDTNVETWAYPHPTAFTRDEIEAVYRWVRGGGRLLLVVDHSPIPGAARDLGALLGVQMLDGYALVDPAVNDLPDVFILAAGTLKPHALVSGRSQTDKVDAVATFTGHAFLASPDYRPLLVLGPKAVVRTRLNMNFSDIPREEWPDIPAAGLLQGAARRLGTGRVVVLGEAAMCSAQIAGPDKWPMGMNNPRAAQNPQFCLNVVRWLSGVLEP